LNELNDDFISEAILCLKSFLAFPSQFSYNIEGEKITMTESLGSALSGLSAAAVSQNITANNIANVSTPGYKDKRAIQTESPVSGVRVSAVQSTDRQDLAGNLVNLSINKTAYSANLKTIKAQDGMLGTLIDLIR
jgi:flagellar hook protein FlgE